VCKLSDGMSQIGSSPRRSDASGAANAPMPVYDRDDVGEWETANVMVGVKSSLRMKTMR